MLFTPLLFPELDGGPFVDALDAAFTGCGVVFAYCPFIVVLIGLNPLTLLVDEDKEG